MKYSTLRRGLFFALLAGGVLRAQLPSATPGAWETALRSNLSQMADKLTASLKPWQVPVRSFAVEDFGAVSDGVTVNTAAIQKAIDACSAAGGGTVVLAKGDYVSGTIELKSGVMLQVGKGARLLASTQLGDFPGKIPVHATIMDFYYRETKSLIYAENCERIGICGEGEIDGRGFPANFPGKESTGWMPGRPFLIRVIACRNVVMDGIHLRNSAAWMEDYLACDNLIFQGLHVENQANKNNDGLDIDGCHNVIVRHCYLNAEDDGMCFKGASGRDSENVLVENCQFYSTCNVLKFGTDSQAGFRNVLIRNVEVGGPPPGTASLLHRSAISGIAWESVDGGVLENVLCLNVHIENARVPIFLRLGNRGRVMPGQAKTVGAIRHIIFDGLTGDGLQRYASIISGIPGSPIEDVVVRNVTFSVAGRGKPPTKPVDERGDHYPEATMFGESPAYGFWIRHARNITFSNVVVSPQKPEGRPLFALGIDVEGVKVDRAALAMPGAPAPASK